MNELSKFLVESIMEDKNPIKKTVVIYVGRFQPMHKGHAGTYQHLVKKFGKDNVYVVHLIRYNYLNHLLTLKKR